MLLYVINVLNISSRLMSSGIVNSNKPNILRGTVPANYKGVTKAMYTYCLCKLCLIRSVAINSTLYSFMN